MAALPRRPQADILHNLNLSALTSARGRHRPVRKSTRPRVRLEREFQQCAAVSQIADRVAIEIQELLATWAVALPQRPDCTT
jgi:hypothetical protein